MKSSWRAWFVILCAVLLNRWTAPGAAFWGLSVDWLALALVYFVPGQTRIQSMLWACLAGLLADWSVAGMLGQEALVRLLSMAVVASVPRGRFPANIIWMPLGTFLAVLSGMIVRSLTGLALMQRSVGVSLLRYQLPQLAVSVLVAVLLGWLADVWQRRRSGV